MTAAALTSQRRDIQILRAVAVLAVLFYHADPDTVANGFLGVDIFFAISGFLITGLILRADRENRFSFGAFYLRRASTASTRSPKSGTTSAPGPASSPVEGPQQVRLPRVRLRAAAQDQRRIAHPLHELGAVLCQ